MTFHVNNSLEQLKVGPTHVRAWKGPVQILKDTHMAEPNWKKREMDENGGEL